LLVEENSYFFFRVFPSSHSEYPLHSALNDLLLKHIKFSFKLSFPLNFHILFPHGPRVDKASNRNEYQESSWGVKGGRHVMLTLSQASISRLSRKF
jgi:hypothetical protein